MRKLTAGGAAAAGLLAALPALGATINLNQDFVAKGPAGAWTLKSKGNTFILQSSKQKDLVGKAPGAAVSPPRATWTAATDHGAAMTVTFTFQPCAIGDVRGPIIAEVMVGDQRLKGCAAPAGG